MWQFSWLGVLAMIVLSPCLREANQQVFCQYAALLWSRMLCVLAVSQRWWTCCCATAGSTASSEAAAHALIQRRRDTSSEQQYIGCCVSADVAVVSHLAVSGQAGLKFNCPQNIVSGVCLLHRLVADGLSFSKLWTG
eukprot:GHUV01019217.1.p1 GENE.GHUV01019217.1~~GHUV01019217.1.p1  ORF type:complete len:137 (+),score=18.05 GHUV01019217.1:40-450(+)